MQEDEEPAVHDFPALGHLVDEADEELPEAFHGRDTHTLVGGMWRLDLWAERDHVQPCDLVADHGCLQAGVHPGHDRLLPEQALVGRLESRERGRLEVGSPAAVVVLRLELAAAEPGRRIEGADELGESGVVGRSGKAV